MWIFDWKKYKFYKRKTRLYTDIKILDKTYESTKKAITKLKNVLPKGAFKTISVDRVKEFSWYSEIEKDLEIDVYFNNLY